MNKQVKKPTQSEIFTDEDRKIMIEARKTAMRIAFEEGSVSADVLREKFPAITQLHRNALGAIFKTKDFIHNGFKKSRTPTRKSSYISVYLITDEASAIVNGQYERKKIT